MKNALILTMENAPTKEISAADFVAAHMPKTLAAFNADPDVIALLKSCDNAPKVCKVTPQVPALAGMTPLGIAPKPYQAPKTLEEFMNRVDRLVVRALGLSIHDLPDHCYADDFEDGERPAECAKRVIRAALAGGLD